MLSSLWIAHEMNGANFGRIGGGRTLWISERLGEDGVTGAAGSRRAAVEAMPVVAMALIAVLLGALLWLLHRGRVEEEQVTVIKDILWVEQTLHFHLSADEERLARMAGELGRGALTPDGLARQARALSTDEPEVERVLVRDADGRTGQSQPPLEGAEPTAPGGGEPVWELAFRLARSLGRPVYSAPYRIAGLGWVFEIDAPVYRGPRFAGAVVGVVSAQRLLAGQVPWWVAQRTRVELMDDNGGVLAATTHVAALRPGPSHAIRFDPPGHGLSLVATLHASPSELPRNAVAASIVFLALLSAWSLWAVRRHVGRRVAAERALRQEHAFRKAMEDSLTVGMRARDLDGRIVYVNPAFCRMVGWSAAELVGALPPMPYWLPEDMDNTVAMHHRIMRGEAPPDGFEIRFRRRDGEVFWALVYEAPLIDPSGRHSGWMASVLDVTERRHAEEMARQHQERVQRTARLISMGEMASTLAHELNQPLSAIASYSAGCLNHLASGEYSAAELAGALGKLGAQAERAGQIIRRVHDFVRKSEPNLARCAVNRVVADALGFIEADSRKHGVTLASRLADGDPLVMADRILLEQALLNLVRNAVEAMGASAAADRSIRVTVEVAGTEVVVSVADRGGGIPPDAAARLFQPFFTTKAEGMGMGLNICRTIVEFHRGRLWFEPRPGGGSVFRFTLPVEGA